jgi:hypothetical protein
MNDIVPILVIAGSAGVWLGVVLLVLRFFGILSLEMIALRRATRAGTP